MQTLWYYKWNLGEYMQKPMKNHIASVGFLNLYSEQHILSLALIRVRGNSEKKTNKQKKNTCGTCVNTYGKPTNVCVKPCGKQEIHVLLVLGGNKTTWLGLRNDDVLV